MIVGQRGNLMEASLGRNETGLVKVEKVIHQVVTKQED
jgi:hypothetical protein